jgi:hypothetical protein
VSKVKRAGLISCVVLGALLLSLTLARVAERGRFASSLSSYGSGPEGVRALYLLLNELGFSTLRWSQDLAHLPADATLIALGECKHGMARRLSRFDRSELSRWIEQGGVLIVAGARHYLREENGVTFGFDPRCPELGSGEADDTSLSPPDGAGRVGPAADGGVAPEADGGGTAVGIGGDSPAAASGNSPAAMGGKPDRDAGADALAELTKTIASASEESSAWAVPVGKALAGLPIVLFRAPGRLDLNDPRAEPLLGVPPSAAEGASAELTPLAVTLVHGKGRLVVLASANMLQNAELEPSEGATLLVRLLRAYGNPGPVIFDEYHLGLGERRSLMQYLRQLGAMPIALQLLLIALCWLLRIGARFGAVQEPLPPPSGGTSSFVTALGGLYRNAGDSAAAVRLIARAALSRIAAQHRLLATQSGTLESELVARGALRARAAVAEIVAAVSSSHSERLPAVVQRIDHALEEALRDGAPASRAGYSVSVPSSHEVEAARVPAEPKR